MIDEMISRLSIEDEGFWWIVGLIFGDGCIRCLEEKKSYRVTFSGTRDLVDKFKKILPGMNEYQRNSEKDFVDLHISKRIVAEYFRDRFGYSGKKSHIIRVPPELWTRNKRVYLREFVRGMIDTDGSVRFKSAGGKRPHLVLRYHSASQGMAEDLARYFFEESGTMPTVQRGEKRVGGRVCIGYTLKLTGSAAAKVLAEVYTNKGERFHAEKFAHYQAFLDASSKWGTCERCGKSSWRSICQECSGLDRRQICSCGSRIKAQGVCSWVYYRYDRVGLLKFKKLFGNCNYVLDIHGDERSINRYLRSQLLSFYLAKHEAFQSIAEFLSDREEISEAEIEDARRFKRVKPASWYRISDMEILLDRIGASGQKVFDPFAGWGARAAGALRRGCTYVGWDMNSLLIHELNSAYLGVDGVFFEERDSFIAIEYPEADVVITCPPYWDCEDYGYKGSLQGNYERFVSSLARLFLRLRSKYREVIVCLDDFQHGAKHYPFVDDFCRHLKGRMAKVEVFSYRMQRTFSGERALIAVRIIDAGDGDIPKASAVCSECGAKAMAHRLCGKHYSYFYKRKSSGVPFDDPIGLFSRRPDLLTAGMRLLNQEEFNHSQ